MLLRELKEVRLLREFTDDGTELETAANRLKGNFVSAGRIEDEGDDDKSGRPPTADVDAMLQPIIQMAVEDIDPSVPMLQSKISKSLNTPELKKKGVVGLGESMKMVQYLRRKFITDFSDLDISKRLMRLPGGGGSVEEFVNRHTSQTPSPETLDDIKKVITRNKSTVVNALMRRGAADKFHASTMADFETAAKKVELANNKALQGLLVAATAYVGFLKTMEGNLKMAKTLIAPDRDVDKEDASA
jgi:predicted transcriptional regulator